MTRPTFRRCTVCKQMFLRAYFEKPENCPGPPEVKETKTLKGWKQGRKK